MDVLKLNNLTNYQHYKNRNLIWFKWHIDCLQDFKFMQLSPKERWDFIGLICLACKSENCICYDIPYLERTLNTKDIKKSIDKLVASNMLAVCYQDASLKDKIREDKIREDNMASNIASNKDKHKYGEYGNVLLTDIELGKLKERFADKTDSYIKKLDEGIELKGYKYKSHYLAILKWTAGERKPMPKLLEG